MALWVNEVVNSLSNISRSQMTMLLAEIEKPEHVNHWQEVGVINIAAE